MVMKSSVNDLVFSCDWGTSNFRIRLVDAATAEVIDQITTGEGISSVFNAWTLSGTDRHTFYAAVLQKHITTIQARVNRKLKNLPVLISGMASSTLGIAELAYAGLPFKADGSSVAYRRITIEGFDHEIFLLSGICSANDVMRGEETQWLGLMQEHIFGEVPERLFIMPGTHSKHILVKGDEIIDFKTYMTGEIFNLLSHHSVLKNSISVHHSLEDRNNETAFVIGVQASFHQDLLHETFMVRTNDLFGRFNKEENAAYLSGLIIGTEVRQSGQFKIVLAAGEALSKPYQLALENSGLAIEYKLCTPATLDKSVISGQLTIFKKITSAR